MAVPANRPTAAARGAAQEAAQPHRAAAHWAGQIPRVAGSCRPEPPVAAGAVAAVEAVELPYHPWFFGCQFHPEFTSTPREGHPLFSGFVKAALRQSRLV